MENEMLTCQAWQKARMEDESHDPRVSAMWLDALVHVNVLLSPFSMASRCNRSGDTFPRFWNKV